MKEALKYVGAGVVGTLLIIAFLTVLAMLPAIPAIFAGIATCAIALLPGALLVYGLIYLYRKKKGDE